MFGGEEVKIKTINNKTFSGREPYVVKEEYRSNLNDNIEYCQGVLKAYQN
jgi:hypothetical protein